MKVVALNDTQKAAGLFDGWEETLIWSCLQRVMGTILVIDENNPVSACAKIGSFAFYAGVPDKNLLNYHFGKQEIMVPQNENWENLIAECCTSSRKVKRYAMKKNTKFNIALLKQMAENLNEEYELKRIDVELYDRCLEEPLFSDFVSVFESKEKFFHLGRGFVITKEGHIVSGASSYSRYRDGIEIEVDTDERERRKHLAEAASAALILDCIKDGLYPSWDAQNMNSVHLAQKLGYEFSHEYTAFEYKT